MFIKYQGRLIQVSQEDAAKFNWVSRDLSGEITMHIDKPEELLTDGGYSTGTFVSQKGDKVLEKGCDTFTLQSWRKTISELKSVLLPEGAFETWCPETTFDEGCFAITDEDVGIKIGEFEVKLIKDFRSHTFWFDFQDSLGNFTGYKFNTEVSAADYIFNLRGLFK